MKKKWDDVLKALEAVDGGAELIEALNDKVKTDIEAEKQKGIKATGDANKEAKGLRERLKKVTETLGLDPESDDFDTSVTSLKELKDKGVQKPNVKTDPDYIALKKQMDERDKKDQERDKKEVAAREKSVKALKRVELTKAMTAKKVVPDAQDELMAALDGRLHVDDEDKVTWKGDTEGEFITVEDGLGNFLEKKPFYVANDQNPGGGSGPKNQGGGGSPSKEPTVDERRKQLNAMTRSAL